ncbi:MAG: hypothetical protein WC340_07865 [Kiritimatiellia bacterium]
MKEQKSIAAVMQAKKTSAIEEVSNLLWQDKPAEKIASVAIAGGLTPTEVEKVEAFISHARAELSKLEVYDVQKLKQDAISAKAAFQVIADKFKLISDQRNQAARTSELAAKELYDAQQAYTEIADQIECNELPADKAPKIVNQILTRRKAGDAIHELERTYKQLLQIKHDNEQIVESQQRKVDKIGTCGNRDNVSISSAGLVDEGDLLKQRLQKSTEDQKSVEKAIAKCEKDITAAVADYKKMPNPFSIEATEVSNG